MKIGHHRTSIATGSSAVTKPSQSQRGVVQRVRTRCRGKKKVRDTHPAKIGPMATLGDILWGTSGYVYNDWQGPFYPKGLARGDRLRHAP